MWEGIEKLLEILLQGDVVKLLVIFNYCILNCHSAVKGLIDVVNGLFNAKTCNACDWFLEDNGQIK